MATRKELHEKLDKEVSAARADKQVYVVLPFEVAEFALGVVNSVAAEASAQTDRRPQPQR